MRVTLSRMWLYIATVMAVGGVTLGQNISEYGTLPMGNYSSEVNVDSGSLNVLFDMAEGFVNVVFPSFTKLVGTFFTPLLLSDDYLNYLGNEWQTLAQLEAGFITCVAFGLLFIVLVPIVGLVMCCCRTCCSNCGGKMKQSTKRSKSCWRQCLCASMLILATLMAIPTVFVFLTNEWVSKVVEDAPMTAKSILTDGVEYINSIDKQFDYVIDQYNVLDTELRSDLGDLGSSLGAKAEEIATDLATPTFGYLDQIIEYVDIVSKNVASISDSVVLLDQGLNTLDTQLKVQGAKMQVGLADCNSSEPASSPDPSCSYIFISAGNLGINIDSSLLVELVGNLNDTKDDLLSYNLTALRDDTRAEIDKISEKVSDETGSISNDTIAQLDEAKTTFDTLRDQIPLDQVDSYKGTISNLTDDITYYTTQYNDNFDKYRYIAGVVLGSILAVIVVSYYLGILLGTCGFKKRTDPSERGYTSNCGGIWLMVGVGLSFIFSWLLMILVLVLFAVGGHSERYVCQPVTSPYYGLQVIENNIPSFNLSKTLSVSSNVTFQNILLGCDENKSLYEVLSLKDLFDLDKLISDIEKEFEKVEAELNTTSVDLSSLDFYNDDIKNGIARVNESGIDSLNFTKYSNELNKTVTDPDLTVFAETLNATADNYTTPDHDKEANLTRGYSYEVLQIQEEYVEPLKLYVNAIRQNIDEIKAVQKDVVTTTTSLDAELQRLNTEIQTNGGQLIVDALRPFVRNITDMVTEYMHWLKQQIEENFGACKPFSIVYNNTVGLVCDYLIDTMNGLWFSLGWCVFMLIPSAIVAMKLAKFYRRLHYQEDYEDGWDDLEMNAYMNSPASNHK